MALTKVQGEGISGVSISANNEITMSSQPAFLAQPTSTQSNISTGSSITVALGTERFDLNGDFASNTFTAPVTGKYQLNALWYLNQLDSAASYYILSIVTSNRQYDRVVDSSARDEDETYSSYSLSVLADMDSGDTAHMAIYQQSGGAQTDISTGSYFGGFLVC